MKKYYHYTLLAGFFLLTSMQGFAADTIKIHLTYKHKLNDAGQTTGYFTLKQQFYTPDNVLFREICYDEHTHQISQYTFYFYKSGKLFTEECFNSKDSLLYILKHSYDESGMELQQEKLVHDKGGLKIAEKTVFSYNAGQQKTHQKIFIGNRPSEITKYKFDNSSRLTQEVTVFKPVTGSKLKNEVKTYTYDENNKIATIDYSGKYTNGKTFQYKEEYSYNEKGLISSVVSNNEESGKTTKRNYRYLPTGTLSLYEEYNVENKMTLLLQYDYKKHYMEKGTQESYYENF